MLLHTCWSACPLPHFALPHRAVGQFRDLVEAAERNKALRETLKQVGLDGWMARWLAGRGSCTQLVCLLSWYLLLLTLAWLIPPHFRY